MQVGIDTHPVPKTTAKTNLGCVHYSVIPHGVKCMGLDYLTHLFGRYFLNWLVLLFCRRPQTIIRTELGRRVSIHLYDTPYCMFILGAECFPEEAVSCDEGLFCAPGEFGYTCGQCVDLPLFV